MHRQRNLSSNLVSRNEDLPRRYGMAPSEPGGEVTIRTSWPDAPPQASTLSREVAIVKRMLAPIP
jgi:hypothetical protein